MNSLGCTPELSFTGTPTITGPDDFRIRGENLVNKQFGLMFFGLNQANTPWQGGTLCASGTLIRFGVKMTGGSGPPASNCNGVLTQKFHQSVFINRGLVPGTNVYAQMWYRDPNHVDGTGVGITDAVAFTVCP